MNSVDDLWHFFETWREDIRSWPEPKASLSVRFGSGLIRHSLHGTNLADTYAGAVRIEPNQGPLRKYLEIHIIDGAECGVALPRLGWGPSDFGLKRRVPGWSNATKTTYLLRTERGVAVADWREQRAFVWLPSHNVLPWWERAAPLRWLLDGLAQTLGLVVVHAAVVGKGGRGIMIGGPGGIGKSTLALACVARGMDYVSDDYCLLTQADAPTAANLFTTAKLEKHSPMIKSIARRLKPTSTDMSGDKAIFFLRPDQIVPELRIQAIVLPRFAEQTRIEPVSSQEGMQQIAPSSIAQSEADGAFLARSLATLTRAVPVYRLHSSPDLDRCAGMISDIVDNEPTIHP